MPGFKQLGESPLPDAVKGKMLQMIAEAESKGANAVMIDGQVFPLAQIKHIAEMVIEGRDEEFYQFEYLGNWYGWNVTQAQKIVAGREPNDLFPLRPELFNSPPDEERIPHADYSIPIIGVPFLGAVLIIDGWQRIYKAHREGKPDLPIHILSEEEEKQIRMPGCNWK